MSGTFLVFQLYGPMAAWGGPAAEYRPSERYPTRSALVGLLCGALGISRNETHRIFQLQSTLTFSIQVWSEGELLRDFHTVQAPTMGSKMQPSNRAQELDLGFALKVNTIVTHRDYRADAYYVVVVECNDASSVTCKQLAQALETPAFIPFLGRKSCPLSLPMQPTVIQAESVDEALSQYQGASKEYLSKTKQRPAFLATEHEPQWKNTPIKHIVRRDAMAGAQGRTFRERSEWIVRYADE